VTVLVVPLAGRSSRFRAFTSAPKWTLNVGDKTILELALESFSTSKVLVDHYVFVVLEQHVNLALNLIVQMRLNSFEIVSVKESPDGQARSVALGLKSSQIKDDFIVWNGDTHLRQGWDVNLKVGKRWMLLSKLPGSHWSFAQVEKGSVIETAEKVRISEFASLGLYGFAQPEEFHEALEEFSGPGEAYVAPLYNHLIRKGLPVDAYIVDSSFMVPLGTPDEVISSCLANDWTVPQVLMSNR
jgi:dTDP-glucose pyrophosphorylase